MVKILSMKNDKKDYLELSDIFHEPSLEERILALAKRVKELRRRRGFTQLSLSDRSGVSFGSIKRFERTGEISLVSLFRIADALEISEEMDRLFQNVPPTYKEIYPDR